MKKIITLISLILSFSISAFSQDVKTVQLEQTEGEFTIKELHLSEGTYVFEIANNGIDHNIGFVIAPEGKTDAEHHIKAAYVKEAVSQGKSSMTNQVKLTKGTYVYFCPLNPTPQYKLIVE